MASDPAERGNSPAPADADAVDALFAGLAREAVAPGRPEDVVGTVRLLTHRHGADVVTRVLRAAYSADATGWLPDVRCPALWATGSTTSPARWRRASGSPSVCRVSTCRCPVWGTYP